MQGRREDSRAEPLGHIVMNRQGLFYRVIPDDEQKGRDRFGACPLDVRWCARGEAERGERITRDGEVIGINTAIISPSGGSIGGTQAVLAASASIKFISSRLVVRFLRRGGAFFADNAI